MVKLAIIVLLGLGLAVGVLGLGWVLVYSRSGDETGGRRLHGPVHKQGRGSDYVVRRMRQVSVPMAVGLLCLVVTRWPVGGVLGALAAATLPGSLRKVAPGAASRRAEAIARWTELIRDSLAASAGLAQAIVVTASSAPIPIRPEVGALAARLANGVSLEASLRSFAHDVDDPAAEFLVCALLFAATSRAQKLVEVLSALIESIREDVSMHLRVDANRAAARSSVRTVVLFSVAFGCVLILVARAYLSPFGTVTGQLVLAVVGSFYAVGLSLMVRLVRPATEMQLLDSERVE